MIKRAPDDPRGYSNRAACFIKLLGFPSAVQDCDEAIKRDPKFIRAYLRKAQAYFAMREYNRCIDVCAEATEHDEGGKNAREIQQQEQKALQAQFSAREGETEEQTMERIQRDPEHSSGPGHAEHSPASQGQPGGSPGSSQERPDPPKGSEIGRCGCHSHGTMSELTSGYGPGRMLPKFGKWMTKLGRVSVGFYMIMHAWRR
ncbi:hypothetical protein BCR34DRAFT_55599 [Clohesyomyces aquaticus]|uniref:Uncharacterized protein n=1 Tax=Clohesyomyces aquaticus TaxID=1231657 RepID=A0A1Y1Z2P0_9PLEO|nr:hypothetical protein BCR34DRAFT_55599 [Clohesyomyces aquaticus]